MGNGQADNGFAIFRGMTLLRINDVIRNWQQMQTVKPKNLSKIVKNLRDLKLEKFLTYYLGSLSLNKKNCWFGLKEI